MPGTGLSWAHADGLVAVAVGPGRVGVDVERLTGSRLTPRAAGAWVRGEALVKCGHGNLDRALSWDLSWPPAPGGQDYRLTDSQTVVLTDAVTAEAVCAVAAESVAAWDDTMVSSLSGV